MGEDLANGRISLMEHLRDTTHLLVPPVKKFPGCLLRSWRCVGFKIIDDEVVEFLVVKVVEDTTPLTGGLEGKVELVDCLEIWSVTQVCASVLTWTAAYAIDLGVTR